MQTFLEQWVSEGVITTEESGGFGAASLGAIYVGLRYDDQAFRGFGLVFWRGGRKFLADRFQGRNHLGHVVHEKGYKRQGGAGGLNRG